MISVVFPTFNEEGNVAKLHARILEALKGVGEPWEIVAVDDGSRDGTMGVLKTLKPLRIVAFARNAGQTSALDAGLKAAKGDTIVTLDADLQNDPNDIPRLVAKLKEGYDVVSGWRQSRNDPEHRKYLSRAANWLTGTMTGLYLHDSACAMKAYRASAVKGVDLYGEMHVFLPAILHWRGARVAELVVEHHERYAGVSKHFFMKAVRDIADLVSLRFLARHLARPFLFFANAGVGACFLSIASMAAVFLPAPYRPFSPGTMWLTAVILAALSVVLFMMGLLAEILIRVYYVGGRAPYIIREVIEN